MKESLDVEDAKSKENVMEKVRTTALYLVIFKDGTKHTGTDLFNTRWLEMPNKEIETIYYKLPTGHILQLHGAESYYHMVEAVKDINGDKSGQERVEYIYLMCRKADKVLRYKISVSQKANENFGDMKVDYINVENKEITKLNPMGWRPFIKEGK